MSVTMHTRCRGLPYWMILAPGVLHLHSAISQQQDAGQMFFEGYELLKQSKAKEAAAKFEAGLKLEPKNALAHFYLGDAYRALGDKALALEQYKKSLELDAKSQVADAAKGFVAELSGKLMMKPYQSGMKPGDEFRDCEECPLMVIIPPGKFVMGSPPRDLGRADSGRNTNESPPRIVTIDYAFAVSKFEITFDEWDSCVADSQCPKVNDMRWGRGKQPVINVSWPGAQTYVKWLFGRIGKQYRLLSEAEWEYSARGGTTTAWYWGESNENAIRCKFENCDERPRAVGGHRPNGFGLHDMLGNVAEWVVDCWNDSYKGAPTDGSGWTTGDCSNRRVIRGRTLLGDGGSSSRLGSDQKGAYINVGFRVARTLP